MRNKEIIKCWPVVPFAILVLFIAFGPRPTKKWTVVENTNDGSFSFTSWDRRIASEQFFTCEAARSRMLRLSNIMEGPRVYVKEERKTLKDGFKYVDCQ